MIITRTPYRISFFGGGTDYPGWYREHGGSVLSTTIDKYCYLTARYLPPFFEHRIRLVYSRIESCNHVNEIQHPAAREILRFLNIERGIEIHHDGDLPARSGMGSSSAFTVGLLNALHGLSGRMAGKQQLAREGIKIEQEILRETVGSQDQVNAAYGGFNHILFHQSEEISVRPVILPQSRQKELASHLMLFYTGIMRTADKVAGAYVPTLEQKRHQLRILRDMVDEALSVLSSNRDLREFGELLHESWLVKSSISEKISSSEIDGLYAAARAQGAVGGKITGAGGGGFLLLFVPPERQRAVRDALNHLLHVPFTFENAGSQVIFYDEEEDFSALEEDTKIRSLAAFREMEPGAGLGQVRAAVGGEFPAALPRRSPSLRVLPTPVENDAGTGDGIVPNPVQP
jgi:D-glycero-alpha-D-manno-heptose-7-phosphate kinase